MLTLKINIQTQGYCWDSKMKLDEKRISVKHRHTDKDTHSNVNTQITTQTYLHNIHIQKIVYIYIYRERERERLLQYRVVTISLGGFVADEMQYNSESVHYQWLCYYIIIINKCIYLFYIYSIAWMLIGSQISIHAIEYI